MIALMEMYDAINEFMDTGGQVLIVIAAVIFIMWLLIFERFVFVFYSYRSVKKHMISLWQGPSGPNILEQRTNTQRVNFSWYD